CVQGGVERLGIVEKKDEGLVALNGEAIEEPRRDLRIAVQCGDEHESGQHGHQGHDRTHTAMLVPEPPWPGGVAARALKEGTWAMVAAGSTAIAPLHVYHTVGDMPIREGRGS